MSAPFDLQAWLSQGRANADQLPTGVAEALGPERDWADAVWIEMMAAGNRVVDNEEGALFHESGQVHDRAVADAEKAVIRTRTRPISNDITDEWLRERVVRLLAANGVMPHGINYNAIEALRTIIREANHA